MNEIRILAEESKHIMISGHIRPDGDCTGACIATGLYLKKVYPDKKIQVYLETVPEVFRFMDPAGEIIRQEIPEDAVDLFIALDSSSSDRLGEAEQAFNQARMTMCVDHHVSNLGYARQNFVEPQASSCCEVLYDLMAEEDIDTRIAEALYIGIIFDSGVFRYSNTSKHTMEVAGALMQKGIPFWKYIDECFYQRTYTQTQLLGRTLLGSMLILDGRCIVATITRRMMEFYEAETEDIDGIVDQLRITKGVEVAILLHEIGEQEYKVSLRSNQYVDVSKVAVYFSGGGHKKASGFTMRGSLHDVINNITPHIELQLQAEKEDK